ncbi:acetyl-CoA synthetase [Methanocella sp. CWC-04]|uniref:acetate--CoA ligase (ADP-forming) n=1 Tax=Methanooceanicella nereidis TaxID=2052831 RepID=A0AAP2W6F6_9EURY|nr:acetyl-CoA synthetase [Methanocella sp. CWC-04]
MFFTSDLTPLLKPRTIAVIGASGNESKWGYKVFHNIISNRYKGKAYPVNPSADEILGNKCYRSIGDVPDEIDLAVIIVPAPVALKVVDECGEKGVKTLCVITAGFSEVGPEGAKLEKILKEKVKGYGMRMLGPNTMGFVNRSIGLNASIVPRMPYRGEISFISQSGALGLALADWALGSQLGLNCIISTGNKADISEADLLEFFEEDADTWTIAMYIEGLKDGRKFMNSALKVKKPMLAIKSGVSQAGARAAASHTGSLAGSDSVYDAAFRQSGVIRVEGVEGMFDAAMALSTQPRPKGNRVAILSNGGGAAIMASDACERRGMKVPPLNKYTSAGIARLLPAFASVKNPVDTVAMSDYELYRESLKILINDDDIDCVMVIYAHGGFTDAMEPANAVVDALKEKYPKPLVACWMGGEDIESVARMFRKNRVPYYPVPERAAESLRCLIDYNNFLTARSKNDAG